MPTVTVSELARLLEYSQPRITDFIGEGMPAGPHVRGRAGRQVNIRSAVDWLIRREVEKWRTRDGGESAEDADLRKKRADANLAEIKAMEAANILIPLEEAEQTAERAGILFATQLDGLAGRLASRLAGESDAAVIREILYVEAKRIRDAVAAELQIGPDRPADGEGDQAASDEDGEPVGGPGADATDGERGAGAVA